MKWILIWAIYQYGGGSVEFDGEAACRAAVVAIKEQKLGGMAVCVIKAV
jgi:hypothetical protein